MEANPYRLLSESEIVTPALAVYRQIMQRNLQEAVRMAGNPQRLMPHLKTAKMAEVVRAYRDLGVEQFKCATIAEAELAARAGATRVLLAYPAVGPQADRLARLSEACPETEFLGLIDSDRGLDDLLAAARRHGLTLPVMLDLDVGMHRTGIAPSDSAVELYRRLTLSPHLTPGGLHVYDGHIHDQDLSRRRSRVHESFSGVERFLDALQDARLPVPRVVAGGSPTYPIHCENPQVLCSPGTCVFWDFGYQQSFPDLKFEPAAVLLTRVISKPTDDCVTLDLGYKAVAAESPFPRVRICGLEETHHVSQSEEHLVIRVSDHSDWHVGQLLYAIPRHICPTVALFQEVLVADEGEIVDRWQVAARDRRLTV